MVRRNAHYHPASAEAIAPSHCGPIAIALPPHHATTLTTPTRNRTLRPDCSACVADALAGYTPPAVAPFVPTVLGMGTVGDYGTVVLGEDFADFPLGTAVELEMVPR